MIILVFFLGLGLSFIGSLPLGMINLTVSALAMRRGLTAALWFALGAALVERVQSFIAVRFSHLFLSGTMISTIFNWLAVVIFLGVGLFFLFRQVGPLVHRNLSPDPSVISRRDFCRVCHLHRK